MGMNDDFEASLQVLRGFDTDISIEVNEIKVRFFSHYFITPEKTKKKENEDASPGIASL